jgi:ornithine cyclodeaminase/alanine dehydrogenase-like protein (mu-crystallin family)
MTETIIQLDTDEVWQAVARMDPVAAVAEDLVLRTVDRTEHARRTPGRLVPWPGPSSGQPDTHVALESATGEVSCVAPVASLYLARSAALVALAARELLIPGGLTVGVVGIAAAVQPQLAVIFRHLRDISHVALSAVDGDRSALDASELLDQLELNGIRVSVTTSVADALFGANLVIVVGDAELDGLRVGRFAGGAVVVNATGRDLPAELVDQIDDVYVDDLGLVGDNSHRQVVAAHLSVVNRAKENTGGHEPRIVADLGLLLTDPVRRRTPGGATTLVELLGVTELSVDFTHQVWQAARRAGLGATVQGSPA